MSIIPLAGMAGQALIGLMASERASIDAAYNEALQDAMTKRTSAVDMDSSLRTIAAAKRAKVGVDAATSINTRAAEGDAVVSAAANGGRLSSDAMAQIHADNAFMGAAQKKGLDSTIEQARQQYFNSSYSMALR